MLRFFRTLYHTAPKTLEIAEICFHASKLNDKKTVDQYCILQSSILYFTIEIIFKRKKVVVNSEENFG